MGRKHQMKKYTVFLRVSCLAICIPFLLFSCNSVHNNSKDANDSMQICGLLQKAYKWHDANWQKIPDFVILVKDSFQVGVDTTELVYAIGELKRTNFFTNVFLKN